LHKFRAYLESKPVLQNAPTLNNAPRGWCDQYDVQFDGFFAQYDSKEFTMLQSIVSEMLCFKHLIFVSCLTSVH